MKQAFGNKICAIGMMSGTSLDGLDLIAVEFEYSDQWNFNIKATQTIAYSDLWLEKLKTAPSLPGEKLSLLHNEYGKLIGTEIKKFIDSKGFSPDLISSHGHTIFHQPEKNFTLQIGNPAIISSICNCLTIADFRITDIALGGQGAPLVPVGDRLLFSEYEYCLNLGGFANVSFDKDGQRIAYDIGPANFALNHYAEKWGHSFDKDGLLGREGKLDEDLLNRLNQLDFYAKTPPKSLGREWMETSFFPLLNQFDLSDKDKLRTVYEHIAIQITKITTAKGKLLVTGGGAFNTFLMERIRHHSSLEVIVPDDDIVNYKEALIFAFLGVLRNFDQVNCYASVTGASRNSSCGIIYKS